MVDCRTEQQYWGHADKTVETESQVSAVMLYACWRADSSEVVGLLLSKGADPNCTDRDGRSCLHLGCCSGHPDSVGKLLQAGADPNIFDKHRCRHK